MNAHKKLIDLLPNIIGLDAQDFKRYFFDIASHNPKAIIDSYERQNGGPVDGRITFLADSLKDWGAYSTVNELSNIIKEMDSDRYISAIKELRAFSGLGLKESKTIIDNYKTKFCKEV